MKIVFTIFLLTQVAVMAQTKTKKFIIEGAGLPVLLLNGGVADMSVFAAHSQELSATYRVIRMEQFNVQYATEGLILPDDYSVQMESEAIQSTLDSLDIHEPIVLVGHSYGGLIALDFALNYPDRIRSLILIEPPVFGIAEAKKESPEGLKKMLELLQELTPRAEITEDMVKRFRCELMNCDTFDIRNHPMWPTWIKQKNRMRGLSAAGTYKTSLEKIRQFKKPVLIITGTEAVSFHRRTNELLAAEFPFAKTASIQGGHTAINTNPGEFVKLLTEYLR